MITKEIRNELIEMINSAEPLTLIKICFLIEGYSPAETERFLNTDRDFKDNEECRGYLANLLPHFREYL